MQITLYKNFSKRRNSTKQPTGGTTADVVFKDGCSTENPVFLIHGVDLDVNYIGFNSGYYYVDDIVLGNNHIYELHCSIDVLATWRSLIGSYNTFIERSASAYDQMINDRFLSSTQQITNSAVGTTSVGFDSTGCYVFRTIGVDSNGDTGLFLYATDDLEVVGEIYNNTAYGVTQSIIDQIVQGLGMSALDTSQYLQSVMWVPYALSGLTGASTNEIVLGFYQADVTGRGVKKLSITNKGTSTTLVLPTNAYSDFRAGNPQFSVYNLYLPGVGTVGLDSLHASRGTVSISMDVDLISGAVAYVLKHVNSGCIIATFTGQLGVNIPLVSTAVNSAGAVESFAGTAASVAAAVASENYFGAAAAAVGGTVSTVNTLTSAQGSLNGYTGNIGFAKRQHQVLCSVVNYGSKSFPDSVGGRPLYEYRQINTLSGYVKCGGASIDIPGAGPNKDAVNSYLNGGFYYE